MAEKIVTGDEVLVIRGRDKGARGRVRQNMPRVDRVIVEGVNRVKKHQRALPGAGLGASSRSRPRCMSRR